MWQIEFLHKPYTNVFGIRLLYLEGIALYILRRLRDKLLGTRYTERSPQDIAKRMPNTTSDERECACKIFRLLSLM